MIEKVVYNDFEDHPRVGGEKILHFSSSVQKRGSPPRGRGKAMNFGGGLLSTGITPAWAGKSVCRLLRSAVLRDHPRVGGEKYYTTLGCERQ